MDTKGITYFNFLPSNNFTPLHNRLIIMVSVYNYGCSYGAKFKLLYSEKHFHIQRKSYYIQRNIYIFRVIFLYLKKFSMFRENPYVKKLFYIQRKLLLYLFREMFFYSKKMLILKKIGTFQRKPKIGTQYCSGPGWK